MDDKAIEAALKAFYNDKLDAPERMRAAIAAYHDAEIERLTAERDEARANYQFMVNRAADEKLDGYRELGERAANAENAQDDLRAKLQTCEDLRDSLYGDLAAIRAKFEAAERDARRECLWVNDDDCEVWEGSCGVAWTFIDGGPIENQMKRCPQCGGHLTLDDAARGGE